MSLKTWKDKDAQRVAAQVSEVASHSKDCHHSAGGLLLARFFWLPIVPFLCRLAKPLAPAGDA